MLRKQMCPSVLLGGGVSTGRIRKSTEIRLSDGYVVPYTNKVLDKPDAVNIIDVLFFPFIQPAREAGCLRI